MNGVHDLGGMQGFGPIQPELNEPVFHAPWEGRMFALGMAVVGLGLGGPPVWMEQLLPADYFAMSYYQKWYVGLTERAVSAGLMTSEELATGMAARGVPRATPRLPAAGVAERVARGAPGRLDILVIPRFAVGERARVRNINPSTRTRLPRYARGKMGVIERDQGVFNIVDTQLVRREPQHVYSVRFSARELWGEQASPRDSVSLDMWDDYLEAA